MWLCNINLTKITIYKSWRRQWHPLQYSCLENSMDGGAWWAAVRGVTKSQTWLSDFGFTSLFHALEKEVATHSSVLAWRIPGTGQPGGLASMGSHRVGHDCSDLAAAVYINLLEEKEMKILCICGEGRRERGRDASLNFIVRSPWTTSETGKSRSSKNAT